MSITFPTVPTVRQEHMVRGHADMFLYNYLAGGADPAGAANLVPLGVMEDGVEVEGGPSWSMLSGGQEFAGDIDAFLESDKFLVRGVLRQLPIETLAILHGADATIAASAFGLPSNVGEMTPGGDPKEMALGGAYKDGANSLCPTFWGLVIRHPNEGVNSNCDGFQGYTQLWKCLVKATGSRKYVRGFLTQAIEIQALWDTSVTIEVTSGAGGPTVRGSLGKYRVNLS